MYIHIFFSFWLWKCSIIISSLIVNWYEWLDEVLTVFSEFVFEFGVQVKIPKFFMGLEDPVELLIKTVEFYVNYVFFVIFCWLFYILLEWWEDKVNPSLLFVLFVFLDPLLLIIRLNYRKDNSLIFFENSYIC
jgi:hypothetical protein